MSDSVRLRKWQVEALQELERCPDRNFLAVATPGAGKTLFALAAVRRMLARQRVRRVAVVVPTQHLKLQWAHAAEALGIHLDWDWTSSHGVPSDVHGVVLTYQQVAANPEVLRSMFGGSFVVLDEIHHAADSQSWGDSIRQAFETSALRLCLSGTPFRSDQSRIPFVRYEDELAQADYEYGYGEALAETRVVRPIYFPRIKGQMEWTAPDGTHFAHDFDAEIGRTLASQRLRTALSFDGEWLPSVLENANRQLEHLRSRDPRAGGMVIAIDQDHARGIAKILRDRVGCKPVVATSDDPRASEKISAFDRSDDPWIVAVRMVSEGVDIPRLRVGVYATNTMTDLFFRQAVGRLVRWHGPARRQTAYMFIPDDLRLRLYAQGIAEQRRHSLRKRHKVEDEIVRDPDADSQAPEEQMSLFSAISAVPLDAEGRPLQHSPVLDHDDSDDSFADPDEAVEFELTLPAPEPLAPAPELIAEVSDRKQIPQLPKRKQLRELNSARVRELVHMTGKGHAEINRVLNSQVGIRRITEATAKQLERRLDAADQWMRRGRR